ncbi:MAG: hypothetical protein R2911_45550 [Caldilineaceae bacterium]
MSRQRTILTTIGIMLGLFMASMETTVIATAMPTIVSQLGGLTIYSWAFSVYMLALLTPPHPFTASCPTFYGRRPVFAVAMRLFSRLARCCGFAQSMGSSLLSGAARVGRGGRHAAGLCDCGRHFQLSNSGRLCSRGYSPACGAFHRLWSCCWAAFWSIRFRGTGSSGLMFFQVLSP